MKSLLLRFSLFCSLALTSVSSLAQIEDTSATFGPYTVHYSVFNSQFVTPEIAQLHGLVRAKDQALINIAVQNTATGASVPAVVSGQARNLIQQSEPLSFRTITEADASYAIASLRHTNEEVMHFLINITPEGGSTPYELKFVRKLYRGD